MPGPRPAAPDHDIPSWDIVNLPVLSWPSEKAAHVNSLSSVSTVPCPTP